MTPRHQLTREQLAAITSASSIDGLDRVGILDLVRREAGLADFRPDDVAQRDPRDGALIVYNTARAKRPHNNAPVPVSASDPARCPVCNGKTIGVIDVADLSDGFTFLNMNLYPVLYPVSDDLDGGADSGATGDPPTWTPNGTHLLQWTSSVHDHDWHNMPHGDRVICLERLARLESTLVFGGNASPPEADRRALGCLSIIKNVGRLVGGSLDHGHQQMLFSNRRPQRLALDDAFAQRQGETYADRLLRTTSPELLVKDYGPVVLLVPDHMRRPFWMTAVVKDTRKGYLCDLGADDIAAMADVWHDACRAIRSIMPALGRQLAFNATVHTGDAGGLYIEFLPYTQETGGLEHMGLWVCQGNPIACAQRLRDELAA